MQYNKDWAWWLLAFMFLSLCTVTWLSHSSKTFVKNKDFTVLNAELPVMPVQPALASPHTMTHVISDYIWHHVQQELWLCGSLSNTPNSGVFKLVQGQGMQHHVLQQGRYQWRAIHDQVGELWLMDENGQVTPHPWRQFPMSDVDERYSMALDGQRYVARALTSMESTCPMATTQHVAQLADELESFRF
ncbi:MAG: hypothetical protein Q9M09_03310 [Mariprofundaceae bacterium]|nr:hypothetical protein [Mariprofundaceae bacterium]